jgi:hypothetical protein
METSVCMICSNNLTQEEQIFCPCDCNMKYCFYCFRDLFEKINGSRRGTCPQCAKPLKPRIQVHQTTNERPLKVLNKNSLRNIRIINRSGVYLQNVPSSLSLVTLRDERHCGKYGNITQISIDLRYFPNDAPGTYRVVIHYSTETSAFKAVVGLNNYSIGDIKMKAEYIISIFCSNFIKSKECYIRNCKFLHGIPANCEWYTLEELSKGPNKLNRENYEVILHGSDEFPTVTISETSSIFDNIIIPQRSSKYKPKYIPISNIVFKDQKTLTTQNSAPKESNPSKNSGTANQNKSTKRGVFHLLSEEDETL